MTRPLSYDLRDRIVAAVEQGMSCRAAAARFGVARPRRPSHSCAAGGRPERKRQDRRAAIAAPSASRPSFLKFSV